MVKTGLDKIRVKLPEGLSGKDVGVICHAPSVGSDLKHIIDFIDTSEDLRLKVVFGPQHGLFGQTQDNMIEWNGYYHNRLKVPVYSLYGEYRKPTSKMLEGVEALIIDMQDVGARPYTYIWTLKHTMEACGKLGIPVWVLDRPNPVAGIGIEGPVLNREFYTFVGGAEIPLCHCMTIGEIALWIRDIEEVKCDVKIVRMENWSRNMMFDDTGLPWILPSPNIPTLKSAVVYPGMVLVEALNLSEARGTTIPFELFGAPGLNIKELIPNLEARNLPGAIFREHNFIPAFNKYKDQYCNGIQIHVTDNRLYKPVFTALSIFEAILETTPGYLSFNPPPYEYEERLTPFDILAGDSKTREVLTGKMDLNSEKRRWEHDIENFSKKIKEISLY